MKKPGLFFVFEGIDGSGKSEQVERFYNRCPRRPVRMSKEPTELSTGLFIRSILRGQRLNPGARAMALLFAADRAEHAERWIAHDLASGCTNICDRYLLSSLVYQTLSDLPALYRCTSCAWMGDDVWIHGPGLGCPTCRKLTIEDFGEPYFTWIRSLTPGIPVPDLTIVLDVPAELGADRRAKRDSKPEAFDSLHLQKRARALYLRSAELLPGQWVAIIDGTGSPDEVAARVWAAVEKVPA